MKIRDFRSPTEGKEYPKQVISLANLTLLDFLFKHFGQRLHGLITRGQPSYPGFSVFFSTGYPEIIHAILNI